MMESVMNKLQEARKRGSRCSVGFPKEEQVEEIRAFLYKHYKFNEFSIKHLRAAYTSVMLCFPSQMYIDYVRDILLSKRIIKSVRVEPFWLIDKFTLIPRKNNRQEMVEYASTLF